MDIQFFLLISLLIFNGNNASVLRKTIMDARYPMKIDEVIEPAGNDYESKVKNKNMTIKEEMYRYHAYYECLL